MNADGTHESVKSSPAFWDHARLTTLLRGDAECLRQFLRPQGAIKTALQVATIVIGAGLYGAALGSWRAPEQAVYTAIKLPLVVLLTALGNALLNGMLAPLLGVNLGFRQSFLAVLMSFTIAATILGAFSPILAFVVWNTPPFHLELSRAFLAYRFMQLAAVGGIAYAGVMANVRLLPLLQTQTASPQAALRVLFAWLAGNLFLGSQICWLLRPFIGRPQDAVTFLGPDPFQGNFYETVFEAVRALWSGDVRLES